MNAFTIAKDGQLAWLTLDLPDEPVNKLTGHMGEELGGILENLKQDPAVKAAIIISGKPDTFIAGADIDVFQAVETEEEARELAAGAQEIMNRIADFGRPVVAAIHGACLGGGLELALACSYRIATEHPKTTIGLPEIQLGILPAAGGCQRLPRTIGLSKALDIILAGKTMPAKRAYRSGIVHELVPPSILEEVARQAAERLIGGWKPKPRKGGLQGMLLDGNPLGRAVVFRTARKQVLKKTKGNYPAPLAALDVIKTGMSRGIKAGLAREAEEFGRLAVTEVSRRLVEIFFATTSLKKDPGVDGEAPEPKKVENLAVVGAGFMGSGIGGVAVLKAGVDVRFKDADLERVAKGTEAARKILKGQLKRRRITKYEFRELEALVSGGVDWAGFRRADLVVEAVFEDLKVKHQVFKELERHTCENCILASNTSTIPIAKIAEVLDRPERVIGMHFFSPVEKMPLLEVIAPRRTAPGTITTAVDFGRRMGKTVIVVQDRPGFWVNRILAPYLNEAGRLVLEGVPVERVDRAMTRFGFPVGPITLMDEVGLDVAQKASTVMHQAYGDRMKPLEALGRLVEAGRLGRKSEKGFFKYEDGKKKGADPEALRIAGVSATANLSDREIEDRLVCRMLNEAVMALDEGVVRSARDGDIGAIFGIGYPPFQGGPFRHLDATGTDQAVGTLERLNQEQGERFKPAERLARMAQSSERFYPN